MAESKKQETTEASELNTNPVFSKKQLTTYAKHFEQGKKKIGDLVTWGFKTGTILIDLKDSVGNANIAFKDAMEQSFGAENLPDSRTWSYYQKLAQYNDSDHKDVKKGDIEKWCKANHPTTFNPITLWDKVRTHFVDIMDKKHKKQAKKAQAKNKSDNPKTGVHIATENELIDFNKLDTDAMFTAYLAITNNVFSRLAGYKKLEGNAKTQAKDVREMVIKLGRRIDEITATPATPANTHKETSAK